MPYGSKNLSSQKEETLILREESSSYFWTQILYKMGKHGYREIIVFMMSL